MLPVLSLHSAQFSNAFHGPFCNLIGLQLSLQSVRVVDANNLPDFEGGVRLRQTSY